MRCLFSFICLRSVPSPMSLLPMKSIAWILIFGPSSTWKVTCTSFGPPGISTISGVTVAAWNPFSFMKSCTTLATLRTRPGIDERVGADLQLQLFELLVDLGLFDLLRALVVDDLDALPLLHVVGDHLADHPVREGVLALADRQVVEEVRVPEPEKVLANRLLGLLVVRHPDVLRGRAAASAGCSRGRSPARPASDCPALPSTERFPRSPAPSRPAAAPPAVGTAGRRWSAEAPATGPRGRLLAPRLAPAGAAGACCANAGAASQPRRADGQDPNRLVHQETLKRHTHPQAAILLDTRTVGRASRSGRRVVIPEIGGPACASQASRRPAASSPAGRYASWPASR